MGLREVYTFDTVFIIHNIVHAIVDDSFRFFERFITNAWGLRNLQTAENEANLLLSLRIQKLKGFQLQGTLPAWPLTRGSAPGPRLGLRFQTPVIGSRSALAMCVHPRILT